MRRKGHPSFPSAMTCCFFASLKTLLIPTEAIAPLDGVNVLALSLAGFQVTLIGRFWVIPEATTMNKADITGTIVDRTGLSTKKAKEAVEAFLKAMKQGLKEDRSIDLGRLGKLRTAKLSRRGRVIGGLKNVARGFFDYSKHAKT